MKRIILSINCALLIFLLTAGSALALPKIKVLATGGTIAGVQSDPGKAHYEAGVVKIESIIASAPQIAKIAELSGEQVSNIGSQDMNNEVWMKLARRVNELQKDPAVDGIVITHGTDTMEETGFFLNLVTKGAKPVVMAGSMRPSTALSADGPMNLFNAVAVATHPDARGRGVMVVLNDEVHYARDIEKRNTTQLDTFKSPNRGLAGVVNTGAVYFFARPEARHASGEFSIDTLKALPRVEIFYAHANMGREFIDQAGRSGVEGIVLAGVGDGGATAPAVAALTAAARQGIIVVRSSRTGSGLVARNVGTDDEKIGSVAAYEHNPQKARVLLMLALTKTRDPGLIQEYFKKY
ncbi:MAG: type II asparaginase [Syntrophaceae bacterium]